MKSILIIATLLLVTASAALCQKHLTDNKDAAKLFAGTWKANLERSKRDPNHQFSSLTLKVEFVEGAVVLNYDGVNMGGKKEGGSRKLFPDGKEHEAPQAPGYFEITRWANRRILESIGIKDGKEAGRSTYEVSRDRKTLTATVRGIDDRGRPFVQVIIFDRDKPV